MSNRTPNRYRAPVEPGQERLVYSDSTILHGRPPIIRTRAQLSLEENLQGPNHGHQPTQQTHGRSGQTSSHKFRDTKPRLLLMGLRR
jgi:Ras-related GTP-binding protein C/D